jgi:hypothetical protein
MADVEPLSDGSPGRDVHLHENFAKLICKEKDQLQGNTNWERRSGYIYPVSHSIARNCPDRRIQPQLLPVVAIGPVPCNIRRKLGHAKFLEKYYSRQCCAITSKISLKQILAFNSPE